MSKSVMVTNDPKVSSNMTYVGQRVGLSTLYLMPLKDM
jgi:hypothetical protein